MERGEERFPILWREVAEEMAGGGSHGRVFEGVAEIDEGCDQGQRAQIGFEAGDEGGDEAAHADPHQTDLMDTLGVEAADQRADIGDGLTQGFEDLLKIGLDEKGTGEVALGSAAHVEGEFEKVG